MTELKPRTGGALLALKTKSSNVIRAALEAAAQSAATQSRDGRLTEAGAYLRAATDGAFRTEAPHSDAKAAAAELERQLQQAIAPRSTAVARPCKK